MLKYSGIFIKNYGNSACLGKEDEFVFAYLEFEKGTKPPETVIEVVNINIRKESEPRGSKNQWGNNSLK